MKADRTMERLRPRGQAIGAAALVAIAWSGLVAIGIATGRSAESSDPIAPTREVLPPTAIASSADLGDAVRLPRFGVTHRLEWSPVSAVARKSASEREQSRRALGNAVAGPEALDHEVAAQRRVFDGRPIRPVASMRMRVTAYSPDERSCGASADGITASGYSVWTNGGALVAADPRVLPLGALVSVDGYHDGQVVPVLDVGGAIKGTRLDVLFPTHEKAVQWGVREIDVVVWEYDDGKPNHFRTRH